MKQTPLPHSMLAQNEGWLGVRNIAEGERGCIEYPHFVSFVLAGIVGTTVQIGIFNGRNYCDKKDVKSGGDFSHFTVYMV